MRISVKGRYALAAVTELAARDRRGERATVAAIAESLGISRIYLEQVIAQLKKEGLVQSVKGAKGGYHLAVPPEKITALAVLRAVESTLFESSAPTVAQEAPGLELALRQGIFEPLDRAVESCLGAVTVAHLLADAQRRQEDLAYMLHL